MEIWDLFSDKGGWAANGVQMLLRYTRQHNKNRRKGLERGVERRYTEAGRCQSQVGEQGRAEKVCFCRPIE